MGDSEEEDYMSDAFLMGTSEVKPGLQFSKTEAHRRKVEERAKKANQWSRKDNMMRSVKVQEEMKRNEKLNTALDESNKGFALLSKMGFKQGMGLGRDGSGISEPIPLNIKSGRGGLGRETDMKRKNDTKKELYIRKAKHRKQMVENLSGEFKDRLKDQFYDKQIARDLYKSQKVCEELDSRKNLPCVTPWYWPPVKKDSEDEGEDEDSKDVEDDKEDENSKDNEEPDDYGKLVLLTDYLRATHLYCVWCGTSFDDDADLSTNCPGDSREDHDS